MQSNDRITSVILKLKETSLEKQTLAKKTRKFLEVYIGSENDLALKKNYPGFRK